MIGNWKEGKSFFGNCKPFSIRRDKEEGLSWKETKIDKFSIFNLSMHP